MHAFRSYIFAARIACDSGLLVNNNDDDDDVAGCESPGYPSEVEALHPTLEN